MLLFYYIATNYLSSSQKDCSELQEFIFIFIFIFAINVKRLDKIRGSAFGEG